MCNKQLDTADIGSSPSENALKLSQSLMPVGVFIDFFFIQ